ncbi:hypothetical protein J3Z57_001712 [Escherichia coli]|nr:hypothetical protein [Escherichia coli]
MTTRYFSSLIEQSLSRSTEATLSIMGVTNPQLREHLAQQMGADCGKPGSFLASPVTDGDMTVICRRDFCFERLCNRIRVSHNCYSPIIVIVMSGAGVLAHIRTALNTWIYHQ